MAVPLCFSLCTQAVPLVGMCSRSRICVIGIARARDVEVVVVHCGLRRAKWLRGCGLTFSSHGQSVVHVEVVVEVPVPMVQEEIVHAPTIIQQARIFQRQVEMIVEVPAVPMTQGEEIVHVPTIIQQERVQHAELLGELQLR